MIQVNKVIISKEAKKNVNEALNSNWLSSSGKFVKQFEEKFSNWIGRKYGIAVSSGTSSLHLALLALKIGKDDEVILSAMSMGSCWMTIIQTGAKPIFVDCNFRDYVIDVDFIEKKITPKTKAIMVMHIYGVACNMDKIISIAKRYNLFIIEDACEAIGSEYKEKKCGTFGNISCFSYFSNKIISCGEGGMCLTDDDKLAEKIKSFRNLCHTETRFIHDDIGYNYRMTNLQGAVGCGEMEHIDEYIKRKIEIGEFYNKKLLDIKGIQIPRKIKNIKNSYWMYPIVIYKMEYGIDRDELVNLLYNNGIETRNFFYPPFLQPCIKNICNKQFPNAKFLSEHGCYLPSGLGITDDELNEVVKNIIKFRK